jgi:uncharacterized protein (DUF885 family)
VLILPSEVPIQLQSYEAYKEGWGLYSEYLGLEMGIYENEPVKELGLLIGDLLRSSRLVVDTGLHRFGWSRQTAIDFIMKNTGLGQVAAEAEIDRYITLPGQAVSYKVGLREIQNVRRDLNKMMGLDFDLKAFHTYVLRCQGPLERLKSCVCNYFGVVPGIKN